MKRVIIKFLSILSLLFIFCSFICSIQKNTCNLNGNDNLSTSLNNTKSEEKQTQKVDKKQEERNDNKKPKLSAEEREWSRTYPYGQAPGYVPVYELDNSDWINSYDVSDYTRLPLDFSIHQTKRSIFITWSNSASPGTYYFIIRVKTPHVSDIYVVCTLKIQYATPTGFRYPSDQHRINGSSFNVSASFSNYPYISPSNNQFTWSVNDPSILSFSTTSTTSTVSTTITCLKKGTAVVTVKSNTNTATFNVYVEYTQPDTIDLNTYQATIKAEQSLQIKANLSHSAGETIDSDNIINWTYSCDSTVLTLSSNVSKSDEFITVTILKKVSETIELTATYEYVDGSSSISASCIITTDWADITETSISKTSQIIDKDTTTSLYASIVKGQLNNINPDLQYFTWTSSNPNVVKIRANRTESGEIIECVGLEQGSSIITATSVNNIEVSCVITVEYAIIKKITINTTSLDKCEGETFELWADIDNVENIDPAYNKITWTSSNPNLIEVPNQSVSGEKLSLFVKSSPTIGQVTLTATTINNISVSCLVNVSFAKVTDVSAESYDKEIDLNGTTTIYGWLDNQDYVDPNLTFKWSCNDPSIKLDKLQTKKNEIVKITSSGLPLSNPVIINALYEGDEGTLNSKDILLYVKDIPITSAAITPNLYQASLGEIIDGQITFAYNKTAYPKQNVTWSVADPSKLQIIGDATIPANVAPKIEVLAKPDRPGDSLIIYATYFDGFKTKTIQGNIIVAFAYPESISINTGYKTQLNGTAKQSGSAPEKISSTILPSNAVQKCKCELKSDTIIPSWLHINDDGLIYWDDDCSIGTYNFFVKASTSIKDISGNILSVNTQQITLTIDSASVESMEIINGPVDDQTNEIKGWLDQPNVCTPFKAVITPSGAQQTVDWKLVNVDGSEWLSKPSWLSINTDGRIEWTNQCTLGKWTFKVQATSKGTTASGKSLVKLSNKDYNLVIKSPSATGISFTRIPSDKSAMLSNQREQLDSPFTAQITPYNARQLINYNIESIQKNIDGKYEDIIKPNWLNIDNNGYVYWQNIGNDKVQNGKYRFKIKASSYESKDINVVSDYVSLSIFYATPTDIELTPSTIDHLTNIQALINKSSNSAEVTGYNFEGLVQPYELTQQDLIWSLSGPNNLISEYGIHFGKKENNENPTAIYWNDKINAPIHLDLKVNAKTISGSLQKSFDINIKFDYAKVKEINLNKQFFEFDKLDLSQEWNGELISFVNDVNSLNSDEKLFWSVSDNTAVYLEHDETIIDKTNGSMNHFRILKDNYFGFKYKIYCKNSEGNVVKEITLYKPFPLWLLLLISLYSSFVIAGIIVNIVVQKKKQTK